MATVTVMDAVTDTDTGTVADTVTVLAVASPHRP
jgi:hypothetical protein